MYKLSAIILSLFIFAEIVSAQDKDISKEPIDYFGEKTKAEKKLLEQQKIEEEAASKEEEVIEDPWIVPITQADGSIKYHRPPQVVINFLENPKEEANVKAYFEWNQKKIRKFIEANAALQAYAAKRGISMPYYSTTGKVYDFKKVQEHGSLQKYISRTKGVNIIYFTKPDCPYCTVQSSELEKLSQAHKDISIQGISLGKAKTTYSFPVKEDQGENDAYKIDFWPTLLFVYGDGTAYKLRGATTAGELENLLETVKEARAGEGQ